MIIRRERPAPGGPGMEPRWTRGAKDAVGTAYSTSSRVWYTLSAGVVTEVYYPTLDTPQIRDLQFLISDGKTFFHDERRHLADEMGCVTEAALGFTLVNRDPQGQYRIRKQIIGDPHQNCMLIHTRVEAAPELLSRLRIYALCAPHLEIGGRNNSGDVAELGGRKILIAHKGSTWMALGASVPFLRCSCGFVGENDGWTDLSQNYVMDWEYDCALDGNIALMAQIDLSRGPEFTVALSFGASLHDAVTTLLQSVSLPFEASCANFSDQWSRTSKRFHLLEKTAERDSRLLSRSVNLLLAHEDKIYTGAMIAGLSIPWGEDKGDEELGGYHLVWTRDMVNCATALLAVGDLATPRRALIYLAVAQREDGGFYQNFWIDGRPYWTGIQLDEVSFPILLAWRLHQANALAGFDPYALVLRACGYLIREGPATRQDRWEEAGGYCPFTLATNIAALVCAAEFLRQRGEASTAAFVLDYADFLESHLEPWTVTRSGTLVPGIARHYIRTNPYVEGGTTEQNEDPDTGDLILANRRPGARYRFPAKEIVDAGFLHLVRYGIRKADDPLIVDSLRVIDAVLKVDTPLGPCWRRYNHDGYGQRDDGSSYRDWGRGRLWPLLTGERGHYELVAGRDAEPYILAMENFSSGIGLIPEQIWDGPDLPEKRMFFAGPTGAAIPLMWAHAEYVTLLRSYVDQRPFDRVDPVVARYQSGGHRLSIEIWKRGRQLRSVPAGTLLRIQAPAPFLLHWSEDGWSTVRDTRSFSTAIGIEYADIATREGQKLRFTFYWTRENRWEGIDYQVEIANA